MKMNKILNPVLGLAVCALLPSCLSEEQNPYANEATPDLTIVSEASGFELDQAELQLQLSHFIHKDVVIDFEVEGVDASVLSLPESYTFPAGVVERSLPFSVSSADLDPAVYTVVITPVVASGAQLVSAPVSLSLKVEDVAFVNLSKTAFDDDNKAEVTLKLSRRLSKSITLPIKVGAGASAGMTALPESAVTYEKSVTIPAGELEVTTPVSLDLSGVEAGTYEFVYEIADYGSNAKPGADAVLREVIRTGIVLNRREWNDDYWDYYNGRFYTYGGLGTGIERLALVILYASELDPADKDALLEKISTIGDTLTDDNTYAAPATSSDYIWFPTTLKPQGPAKYIFLLLGLNAKNRPTGDYDYFEYTEPLSGGVTSKGWSWGYYSGWYYFYASGFTEKDFAVITVPAASGDGGAEFVEDQILYAAGAIQTGDLVTYNAEEKLAGATYSYFAYPSEPAGDYYAIMFGLDSNKFPNGTYSIKSITISE